MPDQNIAQAVAQIQQRMIALNEELKLQTDAREIATKAVLALRIERETLSNQLQAYGAQQRIATAEEAAAQHEQATVAARAEFEKFKAQAEADLAAKHAKADKLLAKIEAATNENK